MTINLGTIVRTRRKELGMTQQDVAEIAVCHRETVWAFENNSRRIGLDTAQDIFNALGLKLVVEEGK